MYAGIKPQVNSKTVITNSIVTIKGFEGVQRIQLLNRFKDRNIYYRYEFFGDSLVVSQYVHMRGQKVRRATRYQGTSLDLTRIKDILTARNIRGWINPRLVVRVRPVPKMPVVPYKAKVKKPDYANMSDRERRAYYDQMSLADKVKYFGSPKQYEAKDFGNTKGKKKKKGKKKAGCRVGGQYSDYWRN